MASVGLKVKDQRIETLRAIAIIFVVGSHLINDQQMNSASSFYNYLDQAVRHIRLPLFTVISGYLYGLRPVESGKLISFLKGKARRIVIPLFVVSSLEFICSSLLPGVNHPENIGNLWKVLVFPYEHYWFLQVIFLIFVTMGILEVTGILKRNAGLLVTFILSVFLYLFYQDFGLNLSLFSIGTVTYLFPYFLVGYMISNRAEMLKQIVKTRLLVLLLILGVVLQQCDWFFDLPYSTAKRTVVGLLIGVCSSALLLRHRFKVSVLSSIGSFAYAIYLFQGFGTTIGRRLAEYLPIDSPHLYFPFVIAIAVVFGIVVELVVVRIKLLRTVLLGLK